MRRRPSRSAIRPPSSRKPPNVIAYAVITHCTVDSRDVQILLDRRDRDIDDRDVEDRHEERRADDGEDEPGAAFGFTHEVDPALRGGTILIRGSPAGEDAAGDAERPRARATQRRRGPGPGGRRRGRSSRRGTRTGLPAGGTTPRRRGGSPESWVRGRRRRRRCGPVRPRSRARPGPGRTCGACPRRGRRATAAARPRARSPRRTVGEHEAPLRMRREERSALVVEVDAPHGAAVFLDAGEEGHGAVTAAHAELSTAPRAARRSLGRWSRMSDGAATASSNRSRAVRTSTGIALTLTGNRPFPASRSECPPKARASS